MAGKREIKGLADIIAIAISPVLIMAMVGALVFFLIEVFYGGEYSGNVRWTMFFFVFGSVLVARISIEMGDGKASLYALGLGAAAFVGMFRFVSAPPGWMEQFWPVVNIGLLVLVWWCTRKLTWDCTHIDEERDASDRSLLEATGLENLERPAEWREPEAAADEEPAEPGEEGPAGWFARYRRWRKRQDKKPHTPGTWVVYFSLAALPIFGLGQSLIPVEETESRTFSFYMAVVYVGSGMGLLMTTAFLGLRRYLKQRKIEIPGKMAGIWLGTGCTVIVVFLLIAAILPRPASETPLVDVSSITGSQDREASQYAQGGDAGKGEGSAGDKSSEDAKSQQSQEGKSKEAGKGQGQDDAKKGSGENKGKGGDTGKSDKTGSEKGGDKKNDQGDDKKNQQNSDQSQGDKAKEKQQQQQSSGSKSSQASKSQPRRNQSRSGSSKSPPSISQLGVVGKIIKWIVFGVLALVIGYFLFRHGLKFLANFTTWAKQLLEFLNNFWARLFGWTIPVKEESVVEDFANVQKPARPFAEFENPFESGEARRLSPDELVKYSFAALEAWAWEHDKGRDPQETPLEFSRRLSEQYESLETEAPRLATLYARLAYARGALPEAARQHVAEFWKHLELAQDEALEARRPVEA
jgi:hypothetical protein